MVNNSGTEPFIDEQTKPFVKAIARQQKRPGDGTAECSITSSGC